MSDFELQNLVHALDKAEKIKFKEYCEEGTHYAKLFDDLNESPCSAEQDFKEKYADRDYQKRYSYNKGYLLNTLLDAMRSQRLRGGMEKPIHLQVAEWLEDAEFLHEKMLYELSRKRLQKAEKEAQKFELHEDLLKILRFKGRLVMAAQEKGYQDEAKQIYQDLRRLAEVIQNKYEFLELRNLLFILVRSSKNLRARERKREMQMLVQNEMLKDVSNALSFDARINYYFCHTLAAQMSPNPEDSFHPQKAAHQLWLKHSHFQKSRPTDFRNSLNNYLSICCSVHYFDDFVEAVRLLEAGPFRSMDEEAEVMQIALYVRMQYFMAWCKWEDAEEIEREFSRGLEIFGNKLIPSRTMAFYMSFAHRNLITGDLKKAIRWNERILDMGVLNVRKDIRLHAMLLSLILYYEAGQTSKLENRYRVAIRAFSKEELSLEFEKTMLELLRKLPSFKDKLQLETSFQKVNRILHDLQSIPKEKNVMGFDMVRLWLSSKLNSVPLRDVFESEFECNRS